MLHLNMSLTRSRGFSLIEVVLAIGIFLISILALVGLLGPTLKSVDDVEEADEIASVVNTLNAFLQKSPDIAPGSSKFNAIYNAVANGGYATVFVYRAYLDATSIEAGLTVGFWDEDADIDQEALLGMQDFKSGENYLAAGTIYRAVLTPSAVLPKVERNDNGQNSYPRYSLVNGIDTYPEGYFAMEVRIFAENPGPSFDPDLNVAVLQDVEPIFTYNTAIVR